MKGGGMQDFYGMYRAKVVNNKDPEKFGRVIVYIPDVMPDVEDTNGLWARPANNPVGGRNEDGDSEHHFMGTCYIPKTGSWVWIFFENGNVNKPYYFAALDLENAKVPPENQIGSNYEDKWTIFKSHDGRTIHVSDDPDDARIEITGKKSNLGSTPSGDGAPVYDIDGNCTSILFDERDGKEKILIRTHKGDYFHIDVNEQMLQAYFKNDIRIQTDANFYLKVGGNFIRQVDGDDSEIIAGDKDSKTTGVARYTGDETIHIKSTGGNINMDGIQMNSQVGMANEASPLSMVLPKGGRDE